MPFQGQTVENEHFTKILRMYLLFEDQKPGQFRTVQKPPPPSTLNMTK